MALRYEPAGTCNPMPDMAEANAYLDMIARLEPDLTAMDGTPALASAAISLKRIADTLEELLVLAQAVSE